MLYKLITLTKKVFSEMMSTSTDTAADVINPNETNPHRVDVAGVGANLAESTIVESLAHLSNLTQQPLTDILPRSHFPGVLGAGFMSPLNRANMGSANLPFTPMKFQARNQPTLLISSDELAKVGARTVLISGHQAVITPYEQYRIKIAASYFSTMPPIGYSIKGLQLIHRAAVTNAGFANLTDDPMLDELRTTGLQDLAVMVSKIILPIEVLGEVDLVVGLHPKDCLNLIDELQFTYPDAHQVYSALSHLAEGGPGCILPIPTNIMHGDNIKTLVESLCQGTEALDCLHVKIQPRPSDLPVHPYVARDLVLFNHQSDEASGNQPADQQIPSGNTETGEIPPPAQDTVVNLVENEEEEPLAQNLLGQGKPRRSPTIRDTTAFRDGIDNTAAIWKRIGDVEAKVDKLSEKEDLIIQSLALAIERIEKMDQTLNVLVSQRSQGNLITRSSINAGLLSTPSILPPTQNIASSTVINQQDQGNFEIKDTGSVIAALSNPVFDSTKIPEILKQLRDILIRNGRQAMADGLNEKSLAVPSTRTRLVSQLRSMP